MSRVPPPSLVFRVRFDRDHEAWRPCVCHSVTPGPADRSPTPPRTCTLRLCPYAAEPPRLSLARATKRALAPTTSQLHHHHRCPPPPSLSLSLLFSSFLFVFAGDRSVERGGEAAAFLVRRKLYRCTRTRSL